MLQTVIAGLRNHSPQSLPLVAFLLIALLGCGGSDGSSGECATENLNADIDVSGVFQYRGRSTFLLRGTITFEQEGDTVRVTDTTYSNAFDRALVGEATLQGNRLQIQLVPKNGDTDYEADVLFLFGANGDSFCVSFDDTNGDAGDMGKYTGSRVSN